MKTISDPKYPIYIVDIRWSEEYKEGQERFSDRFHTPALPENRYWNRTGWERMEREPKDTLSMAEEIRREWWPGYAERKLNKPDDLMIVVTFKREAAWCDGWFSHYTFDTGLSDMEVIESFERYVESIIYDYSLTESERGGRLMGAEDQWRWHGCADGNPQGERTPAPCRCEHCKKFGLVRIDH